MPASQSSRNSTHALPVLQGASCKLCFAKLVCAAGAFLQAAQRQLELLQQRRLQSTTFLCKSLTLQLNT